MKRAAQIQFAKSADRNFCTRTHGRSPGVKRGKAAGGWRREGAQKLAQKALDDKVEDSGRALFILAEVATANRDIDGRGRTLTRAANRARTQVDRLVAYLFGPHFRLQEDRPAAVDQYRAALDARAQRFRMRSRRRSADWIDPMNLRWRAAGMKARFGIEAGHDEGLALKFCVRGRQHERTAVILGKYLAMLSIAVCATVAQSNGQAAQQTPAAASPAAQRPNVHRKRKPSPSLMPIRRRRRTPIPLHLRRRPTILPPSSRERTSCAALQERDAALPERQQRRQDRGDGAQGAQL